ncbi:related to cell wall mannoprotein [Rhynchosporium graminicola]|uniref:Related to cell wall mannoprotein n=1 Tax=Rhynchosporium graminicola TaxID=2792576 RepID=A0A1E1LL65_9HELO|nr:related to cell wall mannoprotein [Rhynchosporium commune]
MKYETATVLLAVFGLVSAAPAKLRREVPQELSHNKFLASVRKSLNLDNPDEIKDPVFGLLGNAAAAEGAGKITNLDCLHQATADRAFTNAKAAGDVQSQVDALIFAAIERNTGSVGLKSVLCTDAAVNPEIQALTQHQDPASENAAADNKALVLTLAKEIATLGGDPLDALLSGTFAPGKIGDPTAAGNTCDVADDAEGCIFTQKLLVNDATEAEIQAAVSGVTAGGNTAGNGTAVDAGNGTAVVDACPAQVTATVTVKPAAGATAPAKAKDAGQASDKATKDATKAAEKATKDAAKADKANAGANKGGNATANDNAADAGANANAGANKGGNANANDNAANAGANANAGAGGGNVQTFTGALGAAPIPVIETAGADRPFSVNGVTFVNSGAALQRSCAVQNNACANAVNSGAIDGDVKQCNDQEKACNAAAR